MAFWIVFLVAVVALGAMLLYVLREQSLERDRIDKELHDERTSTLEYVVPTGQDPVGILAALERAGYTAAVDSHGAHQLVLVACPDGLEKHREQVRTLVSSATVVAPGGTPPVGGLRFRDET